MEAVLGTAFRMEGIMTDARLALPTEGDFSDRIEVPIHEIVSGLRRRPVPIPGSLKGFFVRALSFGRTRNMIYDNSVETQVERKIIDVKTRVSMWY